MRGGRGDSNADLRTDRSAVGPQTAYDGHAARGEMDAGGDAGAGCARAGLVEDVMGRLSHARPPLHPLDPLLQRPRTEPKVSIKCYVRHGGWARAGEGGLEEARVTLTECAEPPG